MRRPLLLASLLVSLAPLAACGGAPAAPSSAATSGAPPANAVAAAPAAGAPDEDTSGILHREPPAWETAQWFNSPPLTLAGLRGKVVFVRWFTSPDCPFCSGSAPALRELHERHAAAGLVVVGMYHHKSDTPLDPEDVRGWAAHYGYTFPVAIDAEWRTLERWWLDGHPRRGYTSVSFLLDRSGVVQRVHLGGTIDAESDEFRSIEQDVKRLLAEPALVPAAAR